jgi:hypothetical protein
MCVCKNLLTFVPFEDSQATIKITVFWEGASTYSSSGKWAAARSPPRTQAKIVPRNRGYTCDKLHDVTQGSMVNTLSMSYY